MMHARPSFLIGAAILIGASVLWYNHAVRARWSAEVELAETAAKRRLLAARLEVEQRRLTEAAGTAAGLTNTLTQIRAAKLSTSGGVQPEARTTGLPTPRTSQAEIVANDPSLQLLELKRLRAIYQDEYREFFEMLGLSPEQIEKFITNKIELSETGMDLRSVRRTQDETGIRAIEALELQAGDKFRAAQVSLLGSDGFTQLREFDRTLPLRNIVVRGLAGAAALQGIPLTPQQGDQLFQAALNFVGPDSSAVKGDALARKVDWAAFETHAQSILSPQQFALFRSMAPPAGFKSRWEYELDAAVQRTLEAGAKSP